MPSPEVEDRFGLRSSSDSERLMGSVATEEEARGVVLLSGILEAGLANTLRLLPAPTSHAGTGGLATLGETASFLLGGRLLLLLLGGAKEFGVVGQSWVCLFQLASRLIVYRLVGETYLDTPKRVIPLESWRQV